MTFPPTDMINAFDRWLIFNQIAQKIEESRPDLADRVERNDTELLVLVKTVDGRSVIAGQVRFGQFLDWTVIDGHPGSEPYKLQGRGIPALVGEVVRRVDAELAAA